MSINTYSVSSVQKFIEKSVLRFVEPRSVASLLPFGKYAEELLQSAVLLNEPFTISQPTPQDNFVTVDGVSLIQSASAYQPDTPTTVYTNAILSAAHQALAGNVVKFNSEMTYSSPTLFSSILAFYIVSLFVIASTGELYKPVNIPILKSLFSDYYSAANADNEDLCLTADEYATRAYESLTDVYYPNGGYLSNENDILFSADYFHVIEGSLVDICPMKDDCKPEPRCDDRRKFCHLNDVKEQKYKLYTDCVVPSGFYRLFGCEKTIATRFDVNDPSLVDYYTRRSCHKK